MPVKTLEVSLSRRLSSCGAPRENGTKNMTAKTMAKRNSAKKKKPKKVLSAFEKERLKENQRQRQARYQSRLDYDEDDPRYQPLLQPDLSGLTEDEKKNRRRVYKKKWRLEKQRKEKELIQKFLAPQQPYPPVPTGAPPRYAHEHGYGFPPGLGYERGYGLNLPHAAAAAAVPMGYGMGMGPCFTTEAIVRPSAGTLPAVTAGAAPAHGLQGMGMGAAAPPAVAAQGVARQVSPVQDGLQALAAAASTVDETRSVSPEHQRELEELKASHVAKDNEIEKLKAELAQARAQIDRPIASLNQESQEEAANGVYSRFSPIQGVGMFSTKRISKGTVVRHTAEDGKQVNKSCNPNAVPVFLIERDIEPEEEITTPLEEGETCDCPGCKKKNPIVAVFLMVKVKDSEKLRALISTQLRRENATLRAMEDLCRVDAFTYDRRGADFELFHKTKHRKGCIIARQFQFQQNVKDVREISFDYVWNLNKYARDIAEPFFFNPDNTMEKCLKILHRTEGSIFLPLCASWFVGFMPWYEKDNNRERVNFKLLKEEQMMQSALCVGTQSVAHDYELTNKDPDQLKETGIHKDKKYGDRLAKECEMLVWSTRMSLDQKQRFIKFRNTHHPESTWKFIKISHRV